MGLVNIITMKITNFKPVLAAALSASALFVGGCVHTDTGDSSFAWPFTADDTITARYERTAQQVTEATRYVLGHDGKLLVDNVVDNSFKAKINERTVYVKVSKVDEKVTQVQIQARVSGKGDLHLDADLDKQIALQLTVTR
jgi:hypothetical protein